MKAKLKSIMTFCWDLFNAVFWLGSLAIFFLDFRISLVLWAAAFVFNTTVEDWRRDHDPQVQAHREWIKKSFDALSKGE